MTGREQWVGSKQTRARERQSVELASIQEDERSEQSRAGGGGTRMDINERMGHIIGSIESGGQQAAG